MTSVLTEGATKELSTILGCKFYHLTTVNDQDTLKVPFNVVTNLIYNNRSSTATVYVTESSGTLTFNISTGTPTVDLMVWGKR